jgi:hypothetical protein
VKKLFTALFAGALILAMTVTPVLAKDVTLTFNGEVLKPAVAPFIENGTTFIPLRIVADNLGATTNYTKTGIKMLFLEVRESNRVARKLYESYGFSPIARRKAYYRQPIEDAIVMMTELVPE